jgi:PAS domain S-box-containing protein
MPSARVAPQACPVVEAPTRWHRYRRVPSLVPSTPSDLYAQLVRCLGAALDCEGALLAVAEPGGRRLAALAAERGGEPLGPGAPLPDGALQGAFDRGPEWVAEGLSRRPAGELGAFDGCDSLVAVVFEDPLSGQRGVVAALFGGPPPDRARALDLLQALARAVQSARRDEWLARHAALMREALQSVDEGFLVLDPEHRVLLENSAAGRLLGPGASFPRRLERRLAAGDGGLSQALAERRAWRGLLRLHRDGADRQTLCIDAELLPLPGDGLRLLILREVTRQVEDAERLTLALEISRAGLWDWDIARHRFVTNAAYHQMLGEGPQPQPVDSSYFLERLHPEDARELQESVRRWIDAETAHMDQHFRLRKHDGSYLWVRSIGRVVERDPQGAPTRAIGYNFDVDVERRIEQRARELKRRLELFVENTPAQVAMLDRELRYLVVSRGWLDHYGLQSGQVLGQLHDDLFPILSARWSERFGRALGGERLHCERDLLTRPDGNSDWTRWTLQPWRDEQGRIGGVVLVTEDIGEQVEHEVRLAESREAAEAANRAKSGFLANMSHEIRTPMTAILGFTDLLLDPDLEHGQRSEYVDTIRRNGHHLLTLINDVLDLSKIEAGKLALEALPVEPQPLLRELRDLFQVHAEPKGLDLRLRIETPLPRRLTTDPVRLRQILTNLLGNALKFTSSGWVELGARCQAADRRLQFWIADSGIGMSDGQVQRLFQPFTQADDSTARHFGGTGLGLSISRRLAQMLGGDLRVETELGAGSRFTLELPLPPGDELEPATAVDPQDCASPAPERSAVERPPQALPALPLLGRRLLLAEDGLDNQRLIRLLLQRAGAEVSVVGNGRLALEALAAARAGGRPFDLVLMDVQMPELDGLAATRELRQQGQTLPVVALTAQAMAGDRERCLAAGCDDYLAKPIDRALLIDRCQSLLASGLRSDARP